MVFRSEAFVLNSFPDVSLLFACVVSLLCVAAGSVKLASE